MLNKAQLQTNNAALDALIARVNTAKDTAASLPEAGSTLATKELYFEVYRGTGLSCFYTGLDANGSPVVMIQQFGLGTSITISGVVGTLVFVAFSAQELYVDGAITEVYTDTNYIYVGQVT